MPSAASDPRVRAAWWYDFIWSVIFLLAAWGGWHCFVSLEQYGESVVMWLPIAVVYDLIGRWGVIDMAALLSVVCAVSGIRKFRHRSGTE